MKIIIYMFMFCGAVAINVAAYAQNEPGLDSTGLPGDNFSLQGALEMFKKAGSPEEFEKLINTENNSINNLDLNGDGDIDYVRVLDKSDKDAHAIILQVAISATESQDVAVIELEKTGDAAASLQIIGDEDLYGDPVIVEPSGSSADNSYVEDQSGPVARGGPFAPAFASTENLLVVNVFLWPSVRYMYGPAYRPWASPWKWRSYPAWWSPWRPSPWHVFHPRVYRYRRPFVVVHTRRMVAAHRLYTPIRASSVTVRSRHAVAITNYRVTRKRTGVARPVVVHSRVAASRPHNSSNVRTRTGTSKPEANTVTRTSATVKAKGVKARAGNTRVKRKN